jgi:hypothetical protein
MPFFWPRRLPVMRWPMPSIRPSFLVSIVDEFARSRALIADHRRPWIEGGQAAEAEAPQDSADGGTRQGEASGDLWPGQPLAPQPLDLGDDPSRQAVPTSDRRRAAVGKRRLAARPIAGQLFVGRADRDAGRHGGLCHQPVPLSNPLHPCMTLRVASFDKALVPALPSVPWPYIKPSAALNMRAALPCRVWR